MYPNLYYAFKDLFGIEINGLKLVNSFGFFVALSFILSAWILTVEFRRKQGLGLFEHTEEKIKIGEPASLSELITNGLLGFLFGYKIIGAFTIKNALDDPQSFILSGEGNLLIGMLVALVFGILKWWEKKKVQLDKPEERIIRIWPQDRVGDIVIYAALFGFLGAKIFHNLENWNEFAADPIGSLIAFSGLTFYGGLICAGAAIIWYAKKHKISLIPMLDAFAPTMMFAYAFGRIGCQISGDGDWGIPNPTPNPYSWLPDFMWSYSYPHNVLGEGVPIPGCSGPFCNQLAIPVYPTPLYELIICFILFGILWFFRNKIKVPGQLFSIYLILNGLERFFIEKIRVNTEYNILFNPTQAELISTGLVVLGISSFFYFKKLKSTH
ncbi:prolipoprotein diacylglyceryl transferase [Sediminibacterium sp.]|jgi:phosphatidylglycerol:prolipoprotein diacylglycerol transferase|uniref:prolipoprotein diacylglyceryl transferase n=1 Tax=Sediminibacterium sp. TaxID=1917865 RepID=UPI00272FF7CE|nr:prolipoprotein diacylglyceryl transferase family protein [Sediminibacterium sp.]MDP2420886.1 prolipoprotein diacylglyceryl transferase [Sediminibacterium sp.]